jgi:dihydrofolate synthase/folylpolyglutamate synthase
LKTKIGDINFENLNVPLNGMYQKNNALLAILTIVNSGLVSDKKILFNGISKMVLNIGFQGRYEYYNKYPTVIMDSAHNVDGLRHFLEEFNNESKQYKKKIVIFGVMRDKAVEGMLLELNKNFDEILLADIKYERSIKYEELQNICKKISIIAHGVSEPVDFIRNFLKGDKDSCLVILGSMYLLGDVKTGLKC